MNHSLIFLLLVSFTFGSLRAQDLHFSHADYAPLILNPALAGKDGELHLHANYRTQWNSLGVPFKTAAFSFDSPLARKRNSRKHSLGLGFQFVNDRNGQAGITTNNASINLADQVKIGKNAWLGLGLYAGYGQRSLQDQAGKWASQYDGFEYNSGIISGETFNNLQFTYLDAGGGIVFGYSRSGDKVSLDGRKSVYAGISAYHLNRPGFSFAASDAYRLPLRLTGFVNAELPLNQTSSSLLPALYYHQQAGNRMLMAGAFFKFRFVNASKYTDFQRPLALSIGLFGRVRDAFVPRVIFEWDKYAVGYAYDATASGLANYKPGSSTNEIFLRFSFLPPAKK